MGAGCGHSREGLCPLTHPLLWHLMATGCLHFSHSPASPHTDFSLGSQQGLEPWKPAALDEPILRARGQELLTKPSCSPPG